MDWAEGSNSADIHEEGREWWVAEWAAGVYLAWMFLLWLALWPRQVSYGWMAWDASMALLLIAPMIVPAWNVWRGTALGQLVRAMTALWLLVPWAYEQAGSFGTRIVPSSESLLISIDRRWFGMDWYGRIPPHAGIWNSFLETSYFSYYPLVYFTSTVLLLAAALFGLWGPRWRWMQTTPAATVTALLGCYCFYPVLPTITPRLFFASLQPVGGGYMRTFNHWILSHGGASSGIIPSGHVAAVAAMAVALLRGRQWGLGWFYLGMTLLIGIATVSGAYHFVCDAITGGIIGVGAAFAVELPLRRRLAATAAAELVPELEVAA